MKHTLLAKKLRKVSIAQNNTDLDNPLEYDPSQEKCGIKLNNNCLLEFSNIFYIIALKTINKKFIDKVFTVFLLPPNFIEAYLFRC